MFAFDMFLLLLCDASRSGYARCSFRITTVEAAMLKVNAHQTQKSIFYLWCFLIPFFLIF